MIVFDESEETKDDHDVPRIPSTLNAIEDVEAQPPAYSRDTPNPIEPTEETPLRGEELRSRRRGRGRSCRKLLRGLFMAYGVIVILGIIDFTYFAYGVWWGRRVRAFPSYYQSSSPGNTWRSGSKAAERSQRQAARRARETKDGRSWMRRNTRYLRGRPIGAVKWQCIQVDAAFQSPLDFGCPILF